MARFEVVSKYENKNDILLPTRSTEFSAGYDLKVAEEIIIPPIETCKKWIQHYVLNTDPFSLGEIKEYVKAAQAQPTLVSTGVKCQLDTNTYLQISVRSSLPLNSWLILANGVGIIDADYYNNPDNEGEIFMQLINLSPYNIKLHVGDRIGQGIILPYYITEDDIATGDRLGGFGSTDES